VCTQDVWEKDGKDFEEALLELSSYRDTETGKKVSECIAGNWHTHADGSKNGRYDTRKKLIGYFRQVVKLSEEYLAWYEFQEASSPRQEAMTDNKPKANHGGVPEHAQTAEEQPDIKQQDKKRRRT